MTPKKNAKGFYLNEDGKDSGMKVVNGVTLYWNRVHGRWMDIAEADLHIRRAEAVKHAAKLGITLDELMERRRKSAAARAVR